MYKYLPFLALTAAIIALILTIYNFFAARRLSNKTKNNDTKQPERKYTSIEVFILIMLTVFAVLGLILIFFQPLLQLIA